MSTGRPRGRAPYTLRDAPRVLWRLVTGTVACVFRYRVTGLSAEAGFFALLSLPPLVLGLVGSIGYVGDLIGQDVVGDVKGRIVEAAATLLTEQGVSDVIVPTLDQVLDGGRIDLVSLGFVLALWSGSRALNVYVDTITIMYGQSGRRGIVRTRALSFTLYVLALVAGSAVVPLVLVGPTLLGRLLPDGVGWLLTLYWPVVSVLGVGVLATLYHVAVPVRTPWRRDVPGAALAILIWVLGSFALRWVISVSVDGTSIYGPLSAPIVVLLWLYLLAMAVLIGAALNAAVMDEWPLAQPLPPAPTWHEHPLTPVPMPMPMENHSPSGARAPSLAATDGHGDRAGGREEVASMDVVAARPRASLQPVPPGAPPA